MKRILKTAICIILTLVAIITTFPRTFAAADIHENDNPYTIHDPYAYPVTPGTKEWIDLGNTAARKNACKIDKNVIKRMDTTTLAQTVIAYPFMIDIYAFDTVDIGINTVATHFDGLKELLDRPDATTCLETVLNNRLNNLDQNIDIQCVYAADLIKHLNVANIETHALTTVTLYTKNNKAYSAYKDVTWSDHKITSLIAILQQNEIKSQYPNATVVSNQNPSYNCHSYAWYSTATTNCYWIDDPSAFMSDGYYTKVAKPGVAYKVYYRTTNTKDSHSAIVTSLADNITTVTSKWGYLGVFTHEITDCPYDGTIEYWRTAG